MRLLTNLRVNYALFLSKKTKIDHDLRLFYKNTCLFISVQAYSLYVRRTCGKITGAKKEDNMKDAIELAKGLKEKEFSFQELAADVQKK